MLAPFREAPRLARLFPAARIAAPLLLLLAGCGGPVSPSPAGMDAPPPAPAPPPATSLDLLSGEGGDAPERFTALDAAESPQVLDAALAEAFGGSRPGDDTQTALVLLAYVPQKLVEGAGGGLATGTEVLAGGRAQCYGMALAFVALCRRAGIPARMNAVHNVEVMQAHNMTEVFLAGKWRLMDPTYGVFFFTRPEYDGQDGMLSARELFAQGAPCHAFQTADSIWTGTVKPAAAPRPLPPDVRYRYSFPLADFYRRVFSSAFPVVSDPGAVVSFPVALVLKEGELWLGKRDGRPDDVMGRDKWGSYPRYGGYPVVGRGMHGVAVHTLSLTVPAPGFYELLYCAVPGGDIPKLEASPLKGVFVVEEGPQGNDWRLLLRVTDPDPILLLSCRGGTLLLDAVGLRAVPPPVAVRQETPPS